MHYISDPLGALLRLATTHPLMMRPIVMFGIERPEGSAPRVTAHISGEPMLALGMIEMLAGVLDAARLDLQEQIAATMIELPDGGPAPAPGLGVMPPAPPPAPAPAAAPAPRINAPAATDTATGKQPETAPEELAVQEILHKFFANGGY